MYLCCSNNGTFLCCLRVCQTTHVNTLHLQSTVCKLSPFQHICPNMLPYSDASCQEAFLRFLGHPATSQAKCSSTLRNVKFSFPRGDVLQRHSSPSPLRVELIIAAHVERTKEDIFLRRSDLVVLLISCWIKPAALLSEVQEFQLFPTLFCKSYYPPLISCSVQCIIQTVSVHFSVIALHEEFPSQQSQNSTETRGLVCRCETSFSSF